MKREYECSWCGERVDTMLDWRAPIEEKMLNCCSDECRNQRQLADELSFDGLKVICASELEEGIDEARVVRHFRTLENLSSSEKVAILTRCLTQITEDHGRSARRPLTQIDVDGFGSTLRYLGMEQNARVTDHKFKLDEVRGALDLIRFNSILTNEDFYAYNFCAHPPRDDSDDWIREMMSDL